MSYHKGKYQESQELRNFVYMRGHPPSLKKVQLKKTIVGLCSAGNAATRCQSQHQNQTQMPKLKGKSFDQVSIPHYAGPVPIPVTMFVTKLKLSMLNGSSFVFCGLVECLATS